MEPYRGRVNTPKYGFTIYGSSATNKTRVET